MPSKNKERIDVTDSTISHIITKANYDFFKIKIFNNSKKRNGKGWKLWKFAAECESERRKERKRTFARFSLTISASLCFLQLSSTLRSFRSSSPAYQHTRVLQLNESLNSTNFHVSCCNRCRHLFVIFPFAVCFRRNSWEKLCCYFCSNAFS